MVLVCGGRAVDRAIRFSLLGMLDTLHAKQPFTRLVHGACPHPLDEGGNKHPDLWSADMVADEWARNNSVEVKDYPADWKRHGRSAGPIRNASMLVYEAVDLVVAAPGGAGTAGMVRLAKDRLIPVIRGRTRL